MTHRRVVLPLALAFTLCRLTFAQQPADTLKSTLQPMLDSAHTSADPVIASPLAGDADKTKIKALLKDFEDFADKLEHPAAGSPAPDQAAMFTQIMDHMNAVNNYIADRPALAFIASRSLQISGWETNLLQSVSMAGPDAGKYMIVVRAAGIDDAHLQKVSAQVDKLAADEKKLSATMMDNNQPAAARQDAANSMPGAAAAARKNIRVLLTPAQNADLDWQFILLANSTTLNDGLPLAYASFLSPVPAPQDGKYTLKAGPKDGPYQSLTTVTLKKGDPLAFHTTDKALKAIAGTNEIPVPDPSAAAIFWQIDPPLTPPTTLNQASPF